jgi:PAS domain S-box-containing protein
MTRILIVEDESIVAKNIESRLKRLGYDVPAIVSTGKEAIKKAKELALDLVLMDIVLKGDMDGIEAAEQIYNRFDIPVVYLTAYSDDSTLERAKVTEPYGYVLKPFDVGSLRSAIEIALHKHAVARKLKEENNWFVKALKSINDNVILTNAKGLIIFMNPNAEAVTGWKLDDALGKNLDGICQIVNEQKINLTRNSIKRVVTDGVTVNLSNHIIVAGRTKTQIPADISASPIRDSDGNIAGVVLVFRDITETKRFETDMLKTGKIESISQAEGDNLPISLMLASSSVFVREGIEQMLDSESKLRIVARASVPADVIPLVQKRMPNVLILDAAMPGLNLMEVLGSIDKTQTGTRVILLLHKMDEALIIEAMSLGVQGCLTDTSDKDQLIQAIKTVNKNRFWAEVDIITRVLTLLLPSKKAKFRLERPELTQREEDVAKLVVKGYSNKEISGKLFISEKTVKAHLRNLFKKFGVNRRFQLAVELYNK